MIRSVFVFALLTTLATAVPAAADGPVNLSLFNPVQIVKEDQAVTAIRLSLIYGKNTAMTGLDLSLVGHNTGAFTGIQWAGVGLVESDFTGWQSGWLASIAEGNMQGLQTAAYTKAGVGSTGVQLGLLNTADEFSGLQFGLVNITEVMRSGLQIGLVNIIQNKEKLKVFPFVNWRF